MIASAVRAVASLAAMAVALSAALSAALLAGGCASTSPESFYTLRPVAAAAAPAASVASAAPAYSLVVGPVRVPEIVDRPQLVVRKDGNEVAVLEQQRWAQPLQAEIAQALSADLAARLPQARVIPDRDAGSARADVRVTVDVTRFDAVPGAFVMVESLWTIRRRGTDAPTHGRLAVREPVTGAGYDAVAAAFARAVRQTGDRIAEAVASPPASDRAALPAR